MTSDSSDYRTSSRRTIAKFVTLMLLQTVSAQADTVLSYVGESFTMIHPSVGAGNVVATFEFNQPIIAGIVLDESDLKSWSVSAAGRTIDSSNTVTFFDAEFRIGVSLLPESWAFVAEANLEGVSRPESIYSLLGPESVIGSGVGVGQSGIALDDGSSGPFTASVAVSSISNGLTPGTWTSIPEPSACLCLGITGLVGVGTRRLRHNVA